MAPSTIAWPWRHLRSGVNLITLFYNQLLCAKIPKAQKRLITWLSLFALLRSAGVKAGRKTLMKLPPEIHGSYRTELQPSIHHWFKIRLASLILHEINTTIWRHFVEFGTNYDVIDRKESSTFTQRTDDQSGSYPQQKLDLVHLW